MPRLSRFSAPRTNVMPSSKGAPNKTDFDFRGLDLTNPHDLITKGRTPFAKNFRLYSEDYNSRRVAVSTRKGAGRYSTPSGQIANISNTSTAGQAAAGVGTILNWRAMPFTPSSAGRLTKMELNLRKGTGKGTLLVTIHQDNAGVPGLQIAESSISSADILDTYSYVPARFIEAPLLTGSTKYWVVARIQSDGSGQYEWASNTTTSNSMVSNSSFSGMGATTFSLNYQSYLSPDQKEKGLFRFARANGVNVTLVVYDTTMYSVNDTTGALTAIATGLSSFATDYYFALGDGKVFWVNGYDNLKAWNGTTVETITNANLPILRYITMHKTKLFGVSASDPNRLVFSEDPGNPSNLAANQQWYYAWLSVSFIYVPAPNYSDPITGIASFQDTLYIFTYNNKYQLYGDDRGSFNLRQSMGNKGAVGQKAIFIDDNYLYFAAADGIYRNNGSSDDIISDFTAKGGGSIQPEYEGIKFPNNITIAKWKRQIRFYYGANGSSFNTDCLLWHTVFEEWQHDTEVFINRAVYFGDDNDDKRLIESSSLAPVIYNAEQQYSGLGKPIDFAYYTKYESMGAPAQRKRLLKYFPLIQGVGSAFIIDVDMDKDFADNPIKNQVILTSDGAVWGGFNWGDGTTWGGDTSFKPQKLRYPGYAYYWQMRLSHKAVENPVMFFGVQYSYKAKRL